MPARCQCFVGPVCKGKWNSVFQAFLYQLQKWEFDYGYKGLHGKLFHWNPFLDIALKSNEKQLATVVRSRYRRLALQTVKIRRNCVLGHLNHLRISPFAVKRILKILLNIQVFISSLTSDSGSARAVYNVLSVSNLLSTGCEMRNQDRTMRQARNCKILQQWFQQQHQQRENVT